MWLLKLVLALTAAYLAVVLLVFALQTRLLFPAGLVSPPAERLATARRVALETPDGDRLSGMIVPASGGSGEPVTLLGFGGNAWNAEDMAAYLHALFPDAEIVAFHYRGYPPSTGRPSAAALLDDAVRIHDFLLEDRPRRRIVAVGFSIGAGVAAHLASRRPLAGLILVTPFDSLERLAREHYRWLPVGLLLRHRMSPVDDLRRSTAPVALIAAERDRIIPARRTAPLRQAIPNLVMDRTLRGAGHNDIYASPAFRDAMTQALAAILAAVERERPVARPGD